MLSPTPYSAGISNRKQFASVLLFQFLPLLFSLSSTAYPSSFSPSTSSPSLKAPVSTSQVELS